MSKLIEFDVADFLRDPAAAVEYLNAMIEDGDQKEFVQSLADLARARGITELAAVANISQNDFQKSLEDGSPLTIPAIRSILNAFGLQLLVILREGDVGVAP